MILSNDTIDTIKNLILSKTLITTTHELAEFGVSYHKSAAQLVVHNKVLVKGQSFSCRARQVALRVCRENRDRGEFCLLVEDGNLLTLWRQTGSIQPVHACSVPLFSAGLFASCPIGE